MANLNSSIQWFYDRLGKVTYSMSYRNGPNSYDCSSAVYFALIQGGFLPNGHRIGNTDSLFGDLERNGWVKVTSPQRGDIFIWGVRGASGGAAGHTGIFINNADIIHCAYGYNGIHVDNHNWLRSINGNPVVTYYRYTGQSGGATGDEDQNVDIGSFIKFPKAYTVNDVQLIGGVWQIKTDELCKECFTWNDNGIPAEPVWEVDNDGYATQDQNLNPGSKYIIPGKYRVLDLGQYKNYWLAMIEWNGLKFWVDIETAVEVKSDNPGTPVPGKRPELPQTPQEPPKQPEPPVTQPEPETPAEEPVDEQEEPIVETPVIEEPPKEDIPQKEDTKMAFSKEQIAELKIATERVQEIADDVSSSEEVKKITDSIPQWVKVWVYIVADSLIGFGLIVPGLAVVFQLGTVEQVAALSSILATAGSFILVMFGIYKSKK